ncbi:gamma carbonic anhydrase family protein [Microvirga subterranea]|uniref:Carbonic anhydrase/acetyltransferase-like protein (Isoleucine patch superfamily) n=1 Tax=Microvirga subterranea TaxID=186651 RepID=A0A370HBU1_9HYPH|nr:gamma carbonic anhydrase family protein [Microvirga subterranea]RDI53835.1 carbonic anhydrase/acetyltransferase-like protein (isoleucine patch superfamily) [Microvirga subterranea]
MGLIMPFRGFSPRIADDAFIAPNATIVGDVEIGAGSSIWFGVVLRGDFNRIHVGAGSNIQDNTVVHVGDAPADTFIGDNVLIGHMAMIHGCRIESGSFIGMQAMILDGVVVESGAFVAAGSFVTPGKRIRSGELWAGRPARRIRAVGEKEKLMIGRGPARYADLAREFGREISLNAQSGEPSGGTALRGV